MRAKPSADNSTPDSPVFAAALTALTAEQLQAVIPLLPAVAEFFRVLSGGMAASCPPVMLTSEEFAERDKEVTAKTIERRCRDGEYPLARNPKGAGWRIPEFYLWRPDPPPDQRRYFESSSNDDGGTQAAQVERDATPGTSQVTRKASVAAVADMPPDGVPNETTKALAGLHDFRQFLPPVKKKVSKQQPATTHRRPPEKAPETKPKSRAA